MNREEEAKAILNAAAKAILDAAGVLPSERHEVMWDLARRDAAAAFAVFEGARKPFLPPVNEFVLIDDGEEVEWVDPVVEFEDQPSGYRVRNGYASYWFAKGEGITYVIRMKECGSES